MNTRFRTKLHTQHPHVHPHTFIQFTQFHLSLMQSFQPNVIPLFIYQTPP